MTDRQPLPSIEEIYSRLLVAEIQASFSMWEMLKVIAAVGGPEECKAKLQMLHGLLDSAVGRLPEKCEAAGRERMHMFLGAAYRILEQETERQKASKPMTNPSAH